MMGFRGYTHYMEDIEREILTRSFVVFVMLTNFIIILIIILMSNCPHQLN